MNLSPWDLQNFIYLIQREVLEAIYLAKMRSSDLSIRGD